MKVILNEQIIKSINLFQNITGSSVIDCIDEGEDLYFVVASGQYGLSVGKGGMKIRNAEKMFKKSIRIFEYSDDIQQFIRNAIPEAQEISVNDKSIEVKIRPQDRMKVIGRGGRNIKIMNRFLERLFGMTGMRVR